MSEMKNPELDYAVTKLTFRWPDGDGPRLRTLLQPGVFGQARQVEVEIWHGKGSERDLSVKVIGYRLTKSGKVHEALIMDRLLPTDETLSWAEEQVQQHEARMAWSR